MRLIDGDAIPYVDLNSDMPQSKVRVWVAFKEKIDSLPTIEAEPVNLEELSQALTDEIIAAHERIAYDRGLRDGYAEAIEANPIRHGRWVTKPHKMVGECPCCSECGSFNPIRYNHCPICGAKMDESEWEEPEINPCRGCDDYDGRGGCKSNGGCGTDMRGGRR